MDIGTVPTSQIHKYGTFSSKQIEQTKYGLRKRIFFLLMLADPENEAEYKQQNFDVQEVFDNLMLYMDGLNSLLEYPSCFVTALGMLEEARIIYSNTDGGFATRNQESFKQYRSLVLGAGNEVLKAKVGDDDA